jgi:hypothetical protein
MAGQIYVEFYIIWLATIIIMKVSRIYSPSVKELISRIRVKEFFLNLTNFIEKCNNIYDINAHPIKIYFMMNLMILI